MSNRDKVSWLTLKSFVVSKGLSIQFIENPDNYKLVIIDSAFELECFLNKNSSDLTDIVDFETNFKAYGNKQAIPQASTFTSKTLPNGKRLYKREHGIQADLVVGPNTILFTIPYPWVKMIGLEIMYGEKLDVASLMILDSTTGTYSTIPNHQLNQFGFDVNVAIDEYEKGSSFDSDLYLNMQIKVVYNSVSAKRIGFNFNLNEVK